MLILAIIALGIWLFIIAAPWQAWRCREVLEPSDRAKSLRDDLTIIIPARNESACVAKTLDALNVAAPNAQLILIDDQSNDGTASIALKHGGSRLRLVHGSEPPVGWAGKLWALQQGLELAQTPWILLLDADIKLNPGIIQSLQEKSNLGYDLVSVLAQPCFDGISANILMPAYAYFFKLLYPFALANRQKSRVAAAAGGIALVKRSALDEVGGFQAWRGAIIDDCTLASRLKNGGFGTWLGLTRGGRSMRYMGLSSIGKMISRSAYVQLHESPIALVMASALMLIAFVVPVVAIAAPAPTRWIAIAVTCLMMGSYIATLRYYRRPLYQVILLPITASVYLLFTWYSALRSWFGIRSVWKGRQYRRMVQ